ncbi:MAG: heavy-metal-associated domain-containing protein, partial [Polyangiaceae bacterium]|nr:heavy-metal-associated domain-containing protein [Polyangiaceae bacterium]
MSTSPPESVPELTGRELGSCELPIVGMSCANCARRIERTLLDVPGVDGAAVNFATQRASVSFDASLADREALARVIEDAGFEVPRPRA